MRRAPSRNKPKFIGGIVSDKYLSADAGEVYLFESGNGGFVTSSDDEVTPLLGEWEDGKFDNGLPPAMTDWLAGYADEIDYYQKDCLIVDGDTEDDNGDAGECARRDVQPMCKAVWGQGAPYNDLLTINGEKCVTGCWATAVAIIMQYWGGKGYHRGCMATPAYKYSDGYKNCEELPPVTVFDYRNLVPTKPKTDAEKKAVAELMKYIGFACKLKYSPNSTSVSASVATPYLKSMLRLGDNIRLISSSSIGMGKYDESIYNEVANGRPCIIRGANASNRNGHFFVADGYRASDDKYHINWGWGSYNGFFALSALAPNQRHDFTYHKRAVTGIQPEYKLGDINGDGEVSITDVMALLQKIQDGDTSIIGDINSDGKITVADMMLVMNAILGKQNL